MLILYFFLINIYISESLALSCLECQILNKFVLSGLLNPTVINYGISLEVLETRMKLRRCIRWRKNSSKIRKNLLTLLLFVTFPLPSTNLAFFIFENTIWLISPEEGEVGCGGPGYDSIKRKWKFLLLPPPPPISLYCIGTGGGEETDCRLDMLSEVLTICAFRAGYFARKGNKEPALINLILVDVISKNGKIANMYINTI